MRNQPCFCGGKIVPAPPRRDISDLEVSIKLMSQVWEREISGSAAMVLLCLADYARDDGSRCFPAVKTIMHKVGLSRRPTQAILRKFRDQGLLVVVRQGVGRGHTTSYRIDLSVLPLKAPAPPEDDDDVA